LLPARPAQKVKARVNRKSKIVNQKWN